jgi:putative transposase
MREVFRGVHLLWRPAGKANYGGHIERLLGTFAEDFKQLPGSTHRPNKKDKYNPDKTAAMTPRDFERRLLELIVNDYHVREHSALGCSPLQKWERGIIGHGSQKGTGLPEPVQDPLRFWRDFLPLEERTVQREGIVWDGITYYADALRPWIRASKGGQMQKFVVRRDPRDISRILFLDPEINDYLEIPYRDISRPSTSIWDWRAAKAALRREGRANIDEDAIFEAQERMDALVAQSVSETKKARRRDQRRRIGAPLPAAVEKAAQDKSPASPPVPAADHPQRLALIVDNTQSDDEYDIPDDVYSTRLEEL